MSQPPAAELTTRDVLEQIDRRLTLIEDDARKMSDSLHTTIDQVEQRLIGRMDTAVREVHARIDEVGQRLNARIDALQGEMHRRFYWLTGMIFASWLSIMSAILLKG